MKKILLFLMVINNFINIACITNTQKVGIIVGTITPIVAALSALATHSGSKYLKSSNQIVKKNKASLEIEQIIKEANLEIEKIANGLKNELQKKLNELDEFKNTSDFNEKLYKELNNYKENIDKIDFTKELSLQEKRLLLKAHDYVDEQNTKLQQEDSVTPKIALNETPTPTPNNVNVAITPEEVPTTSQPLPQAPTTEDSSLTPNPAIDNTETTNSNEIEKPVPAQPEEF